MGRFLGQSRFRSVLASGGQQAFDISTNTTLAVSSVYYVNTTAGAVTLTLPTAPNSGEAIDIIDAFGKFDTYNCIILPSGDGSTVGGFADNLTLNLARVNIRCQYSLGKNDWVVTNLV